MKEKSSIGKTKKIQEMSRKIHLSILFSVLAGIPFLLTENEFFLLPLIIGLLLHSLLQIKMYINHKVCLNLLQGGNYKVESGTQGFILFIIFVILGLLMAFSCVYYLLFII